MNYEWDEAKRSQNIKTHGLDFVDAHPLKSSTNLKRLDAMTDEDIQRGIDADPDAAPILSEKMLEKAVIRKGRGPQLDPRKKQVTIRLDEEVIDYFKADGSGWQTRLNDALKVAVKKH